MSRIPLLLLLSFLTLGGCSQQSGTGGDGDGGIGGGGVTPDPSPQPSVGIPDQNSMSLSVTVRNLDCMNVDGPNSTINVRLADQLNNNSTIPNGTPVYFAAEGGAIEARCETVNGVCSVAWTCQEFRPADGRVTILAWTEGTESFNDNNGNGFYDPGDTMISDTDMDEPFIDKNENGIREAGEEFVNYPNPGLATGGTHDTADGLYSGVNCAFPGECASNQSIFIYRRTVLIMSAGFSVVIIPIEDTGTGYDVYSGASPVDIGNNPTLLFLIADGNGNGLPEGTSVNFDSGDLGDLPGNTSFTAPGTAAFAGNGPPWAYEDLFGMVYGVRINEKSDNTAGENGSLIINVEVENRSPVEVYIDLFDPPM
jgi:hypothetical protein